MSLSFLYYVLLRYLSGAMQAFRSVFGSFGDLLPSSRVAQLENRLNQAETENGDRKRMYEQQIRELEQEQKNESLKNRELTRELEKTQAQMKRFQGELYNTSEQLRLSGYNLAQERSATRGLQTRLDQCQSLLQTRTQELRNAQAILTIDNEPSDSDILRKIGNLNATVFQCSAQLVENWTYKLEMNQGRKDAHEGAVRFLGQEMADALLSLSEPDGEQEIIAQLAVQACFLNAIRGIISTWDLRGSGSQTEEVYTILRKNESQITGGKWRSLTLRYLRGLPQVKETEVGLDQMLLESLSYTLLVSGVDSTPQEVYENVVSRCRENVQNVIKEALVAREAIKVNVASRDFEVMAPKYGANFDSENMEASSKPHNQGSRPDKVFCVTDIGLVRRQTVDGGQPGVVEFSEQIIVPLKAKVILQSEIMEMVGIGPSDSTAEDGSRRE